MKASKFWTLLLLPALALTACGGGDDNDLDDRLGIADPKVRFVHAVNLGPNVTVYRGGDPQGDATNVGYRYASQYFDVSSGTATWSISTTDASATPLATATIDPSRGHKYTLVALPGDGIVDALVIDDPFDIGLTRERARVRVLNASINSQNVDIYLTDPAVDLATVGPNFAALQFKTTQPASGQDSQEFVGGNYQLRITNAGTKDVIFSAPVTLDDDADWLLLTIPSGGLGTLVPDDIRVLVAKSDDTSQTTIELQSQ